MATHKLSFLDKHLTNLAPTVYKRHTYEGQRLQLGRLRFVLRITNRDELDSLRPQRCRTHETQYSGQPRFHVSLYSSALLP